MFSHFPQKFALSEMSLWFLFVALFFVLYLIVRVFYTRRLRRKIELGELQPITAQVHGFRKDSENDVYAFCLVRVNGQEKEVCLTSIYGKHYKVGQRVTLYLNPETGEVLHFPRMDTAD